MTLTVIPFAITTAFAGIFVYSAAHEFMRRRREGPPKDRRDAFEFDRNAPSYVPPAAPAHHHKTTASETHSETQQ